MTDLFIESLRVMVIDDQKTMRSIVRQLLNQLGIRDVSEAEDPSKAIEESHSTGFVAPDLFICDLHMDGMDGMEFVSAVRRGKTGIPSEAPIIVLTGEDDNFILDVAYQAGATVVLKKPVSSSDLLVEIQNAIGFNVSP